MALTEGQQKLCRCYHYDLVVEPHHLWPIACSLQIHAAPMFHNFQTDKHMGIPPRIAFGGLKIACLTLLLVKRSSSPRSFLQETTCPPCRLT
ncbi:Os01g0658800, partial [Oryza sativa Japonica Group]